MRRAVCILALAVGAGAIGCREDAGAGSVDATEIDAAVTDAAAMLDARVSDATRADSGTFDAASPDAAPVDTGTFDASFADAAPVDTGTFDASFADAMALDTGAGAGDAGILDAANAAPVITSTPAGTATVFFEYAYDVVCVDPQGDAISVTVTPTDDCGGGLTPGGPGRARYAFTPAPPSGGTHCTLGVSCSNASRSVEQLATVAIRPPAGPHELTFGPFAPWAAPIDDYIATSTTRLGSASFMRDIHDLSVFDDRLYIAYGDADRNLGPIEVRAFHAPRSSAVTAEFIVDEEQISHYRTDGDRLLIPGMDATESLDFANAYVLHAARWHKSRTLALGWHTHDAARAGDTLFACGSGGTSADYANGTVHGMLWRSDDQGLTYQTEAALPHPHPPGDHRLYRLLVVDDRLYAFGYRTEGPRYYDEAYVHDATGLVPFAGVFDFLVLASEPIAADRGVLAGIEMTSPPRHGTRVLTTATVTAGLAFAGKAVADIAPLQQGRVLVLYADGDDYPAPPGPPWQISVATTTTGHDELVCLTQALQVWPRAVAFWRRSLYLGLSDGSVWRSQGQLP